MDPKLSGSRSSLRGVYLSTLDSLATMRLTWMAGALYLSKDCFYI